MDTQWYAVYTRSRHEKAIGRLFAEKSIDYYLPLIGMTSQWKDRKKYIEKPLFPGYVFVNIDVADFRTVLSTDGVVRFLGYGYTPTPLPEREVIDLQRVVESDIEFDPYPHFGAGDEVYINRGVLEGIRGRIVERRGVYKLILSIDMIKKSVSVEIDVDDVELCS